MSFVHVLAGRFLCLDKCFHISLWSRSMLSSRRLPVVGKGAGDKLAICKGGEFGHGEIEWG